jgi:hypothetical protein
VNTAKDRDPATNTAKEGKVVVDNTAPTVDAATFNRSEHGKRHGARRARCR